MNNDYELIEILEQDGFTIHVEKTWEELSISNCFDSDELDINDLQRQVDAGDLDWFMLRVRASLRGHVLGEQYLGGCLYEYNKVRDVLTDGTAEDLIKQAITEARYELDQLVAQANELTVEA